MKVTPQLIKDCQNKDRRAQFQLYQVCFPVLMGVCVRYNKNREDAASILNVGFMKILSNIKKYREPVPFEAWIRRIMINTLIDNFRKNRKVRELIEHTDFSESEPFTAEIAYDRADKLFEAEDLERLIRQLPPVSQKVFNLYAIDGYIHREIAELLGMSEGTSKWHLSFARKKLQDMMKETINAAKIV